MTTDAKVGLLLGLVFIVIIAFLINGLPDFLRPLPAGDCVAASVGGSQGRSVIIGAPAYQAVEDVTTSIPLRVSEPPTEEHVVHVFSQQPIESAKPDKQKLLAPIAHHICPI